MSEAGTQVTIELPEELVYAPAVLILSEDLYPRKLEVVREYIQNASDALDDFRPVAELIEDRAEPVIKISVQGRSLVIFDTGTGMDALDMPKLKRIAYSEKRQGEEAGYKGIGRLAGIAVADKLKISSTSYGDSKLHTFEFLAGDMRDDVSSKKKSGQQEPASVVINRHTKISTTDIDPESHYTMVELRDIRESCLEILETDALHEYIADIAPVGFAPDDEFKYGSMISDDLLQHVPDYSPKNVYLSSGGERTRIYKPYNNSMMLSPPKFFEILDPDERKHTLAYGWYATKGREMLGKTKPAGKIFAVDGKDAEEKHRFAGLVYKLFGFSIGDRTLPQRTLWTTTQNRAQWFTGEIHIVDKRVQPTTDRSNFIENEWRAKLYEDGREFAQKLNKEAQRISDDRQAFDTSERVRKKLEECRSRLGNRQIDRADLKREREEITRQLELLKQRQGKCRDNDFLNVIKEVRRLGTAVQEDLTNPKLLKKSKSVTDIAADLKMTDKVQKLFAIVMETLQDYYAADKEEYDQVSGKIYSALRKKY